MRADTLQALREELGGDSLTGLAAGRNTVQFATRLAAIERVLEVGLAPTLRIRLCVFLFSIRPLRWLGRGRTGVVGAEHRSAGGSADAVRRTATGAL
jgi:hypothetical protein